MANIILNGEKLKVFPGVGRRGRGQGAGRRNGPNNVCIHE
jgi:hypothetical protein